MENNADVSVQNGPASSEEPELPDTSTAMSKTTTISTIAVQSGKTRLVIALLHVCCFIFNIYSFIIEIRFHPPNVIKR